MSDPASAQNPAQNPDVPIVARGGFAEAGLNLYRSTGGSRLRARWNIDERGTFRVPDEGPVILAGNHIGWLDGPLMIGLSPRPAHALVKSEAFTGFNRILLRLTSQIEVQRKNTDVGAIRSALKALRAEQCVMIWPEGTRGDGELRTMNPGAGYLALVTGAPVVPVAIFGTRPRGGAADSKPAKGATIEIMYGDPFWPERQDWPRTRTDIRGATEEIGEHMRAHLARAKDQSHIGLPGPLGSGHG